MISSYGDQFSKEYITISIGVVLATVILLRLVNTPEAKAKRTGAKLPPGPKRQLIIGNLRNFPKGRWYETFSRWKQEFGEPPSVLPSLLNLDLVRNCDEIGDLVYINILGTQMVICNSLEIAEELAGRRARIYSGRFWTTMQNKLYVKETFVATGTNKFIITGWVLIGHLCSPNQVLAIPNKGRL
jgi:hypothetical protein